MYKDLGLQNSSECVSTEKDEYLCSRLLHQDGEALAVVFDRYSGRVYAVALRILRDPAAAEDVLQDVFLQFWRKPGGFTATRGSLGGWLAVNSRNRSIDVLRRRKSFESSDAVDLPCKKNLAVELERQEVITLVCSLAERLPPKQQQTLQMAFFDELTHSQIAAKTGVPIGTIKSRSRTALSTLRCHFSELKPKGDRPCTVRY